MVKRTHRQVNCRLGHCTPAVRDCVAKGHSAGKCCRWRELQRTPTIDVVEVTLRIGEAVDVGDSKHVAVWISVVVEHRKHGRLARPNTVGVVASKGCAVLGGALRQGVFERLLRGLLVAFLRFFFFGRSHLIPVLDEAHVGVDQPDIAVRQVVENNHVAVHPELQGRALRRLFNVFEVDFFIGAGGDILLGAGPGAVGASVQPNWRRHIFRIGERALNLGRNACHFAVTEPNLEQGVTSGDNDKLVLGSGLLQFERPIRQRNNGSVAGDELRILGVEDDGLFTDSSQLVRSELRQVALTRLTSLLVEREELLLRWRRAEHDPFLRDGHVTALAKGHGRIGRRRVKIQFTGRIDHPHFARDRRHHCNRVAAVPDLRPRWQVNALAQCCERRINAFEGADALVVDKNIIAILQHVKSVRGCIDRTVEFFDLSVQSAGK